LTPFACSPWMQPPPAISCERLASVTSVGEPSINDDWDRHWGAFGDAVADNPPTAHRSRLIVKLVSPIAPWLGDHRAARLPTGLTHNLDSFSSGPQVTAVAYRAKASSR
jgi:hypothetical protein